jgi:type I restriction enzyme S subunit
LRIEDFDGKYVSTSKTNQGVTQETVDSMNLKVYPVGTVLTACSCTMGMTSIVAQPLITNQTFIGITPKDNLNSVYLYYFFKASTQYLNSISTGAIQSYLSRSEFSKLRIPKISLNEQTAIANYLDHKTALIDHLIAKKEQFIKLLEEERVAVINQAVTKGLDPNVPMKDSGVEWLGEIPEHWEVKKLKYIKSNIKNAFVDGPFGSNLKTEHFVENGDVYVIDSGLITSGVFHIKREMKTITNEHFETVLRSECKQNDIIIAKIGANFGMSGILPKLDKPSLVSGNTLKLTINEELYDLKLIHLQLLNLKTQGEIDLLVKGSAQPALSMGVMSDLPFVIPKTLDEQIKIRNYILNQHTRIDNLITKSNEEIELLKEYKTALISEVVTGKVDVRNEILN